MFENLLGMNYKERLEFENLHEAVGLDKVDVVEALLASGADPNIKDASEESAIEKAENNDRTASVELFCYEGSVAGEGYSKLVSSQSRYTEE
jgi:ankyrin repeat protein